MEIDLGLMVRWGRWGRWGHRLGMSLVPPDVQMAEDILP